ncbi:MAG: SGNH/GDSL hydrolase family protein [Treponema sp.]|nr:SGNH/GDSL hydrolase family protein [Treponema sp.]
MELKGKKILFLGDSITEGWGTSSNEKIFWSLLSARDGVEAFGYGIGGTRIARQKFPSTEAKWDQDFLSRVGSMEDKADVVVVFGGTNDYGHGDAPLGLMDDRDATTFYGALHCLYQALLKKYPAAQIVVMTPLHREGENNLLNDFGLRNVGFLSDYVRIIKEVAAFYALPVLDLYSLSGIQPDVPLLKERYAPDGLHPNDAGHERIYRLLREFLIRL